MRGRGARDAVAARPARNLLQLRGGGRRHGLLWRAREGRRVHDSVFEFPAKDSALAEDR